MLGASYPRPPKGFRAFRLSSNFEEFERILSLKIKAPQVLVREALEVILEASEIIHPTEKRICRDRDDDQILSCALSAEADYLVSGDKELLEIGCFERLKIISPREFEAFFED